MKTVFYIILSIIWITILISIIVRNPHKLILILGKKGSGKSMYCIKKMIYYKKRGWNVYTDIPDVKIKGVEIINPKDLETYTPPSHSALFLDEAGLTFDNRKFKEFADGINQWFKLQRKYKCVVYVNSQGMDIDLKLRLLLDRLILMTPIMDVYTIARPIRRNVTLTEPIGDSESRVADKLLFTNIFTWRVIFMPKYYKYFDSFSAPERPIIPSVTVKDGYKIRLKFIPWLKLKLKKLLTKH